MLILTERASTVIRSIAEQPGLHDDAGLRIGAAHDGDRALSATPADSPEPGDQVIEESGARVFLDPEAADRLDDQVLDVVVDEQNRVEFVLAGQPG